MLGSLGVREVLSSSGFSSNSREHLVEDIAMVPRCSNYSLGNYVLGGSCYYGRQVDSFESLDDCNRNKFYRGATLSLFSAW